jgi:hypothetical protein
MSVCDLDVAVGRIIRPPLLDLILFVKKLGDLIKISDFANIQKKMLSIVLIGTKLPK